MKQFVGLYAVGDEGTSLLTLVGGMAVSKPVFLTELAASKDLPSDPRFLAIGMMGNMKPGLYLGIVSFDSGVEVKVVPMKMSNQHLLDSIDPVLRNLCLISIDKLFGMEGQPEEGEATPAYVNQS